MAAIIRVNIKEKERRGGGEGEEEEEEWPKQSESSEYSEKVKKRENGTWEDTHLGREGNNLLLVSGR